MGGAKGICPPSTSLGSQCTHCTGGRWYWDRWLAHASAAIALETHKLPKNAAASNTLECRADDTLHAGDSRKLRSALPRGPIQKAQALRPSQQAVPAACYA